MNHIRLEIDPFKRENRFSINDAPISGYSLLNNFFNRDVFEWGSGLAEAVDQEINDSYRLTVAGPSFETEIIRALFERAERCEGVDEEAFPIHTPMEQRFQGLKILAGKYLPEEAALLPALPVSDGWGEGLDPGPLFVKAAREDSFLILAAREEEAMDLDSAKRRLVLVPGGPEDDCAVLSSGRILLWRPKDRKQALRIIAERFVYIPAILSLKEKLEPFAEEMDAAEFEDLQLSTEVEASLLIGDIPAIEMGETVPVPCRMAPQTAPRPRLQICVQDPEILAVQGQSLRALREGTTRVDFIKNNDALPFASRMVSVIRTIRIEKITLTPEREVMCRYTSQTISASFAPADAEDAASLRWYTDRPDILKVEENGRVTAIGVGKGSIILSSGAVQGKAEIQVKPPLDRIALDWEEWNGYVGQTKEIQACLSPADAFDQEVKWLTSDPNVAVHEKRADGADIIRAVSIGSCVIHCRAKTGGARARCQVHIDSTLNRPKSGTGCLTTVICCIGAALSIALLLL